MSVEESAARAELQRDFVSFLKGEQPSRRELAAAPLLENWCATTLQVKTGEDLVRGALVLGGKVTGHPEHEDGRMIRTSVVVWLDRKQKWARTWNRIYRLRKRAPGD
jgi:hypothetical protein